VLHLYRLLGWAPRLVGPWLDFASALRFRVDAKASLRELLIVRSGRLLGAEYEWKHHWTLALEAGVSESKLQALDDWRTNTMFDASERAVLGLADETALGAGATETTMRELATHFSKQEIIELVVTAGYYAGVSRIINSLAVPLEDGHESMSPRDS
jgi:alkylhydroperoxidase family enzyme